MKSLAALCLVLGFAQAALRSNDAPLILAQISAKSMGNALIGIVELAPIEKIVELLGSKQDDLHDQQDTADEERVVWEFTEVVSSARACNAPGDL
jgi:hypothetical protein